MHWLSKTFEILEADTLNLRALAILAGGNPTVFYQGADLTGADLRGQDLRGMSFKGAILEGVLIDSETLMDQELTAQLYRQEKRVALVIGNAAYVSVNPLTKSVEDAADVADALTRLGFEVVAGYDLGVEELRGVLWDFEDKVRGADWALVYYSGHAMELNGKNWLIPVDAELTGSTDLLDQAIPVESVLKCLSGGRRLRILILEADSAATEPAHDEVIFCSARHGTHSYEGSNEYRNSFFTEALLKHMEEEGLELGRFFRRVTSSVLKATGNRQEPFVYGSIPDEDFYVKPPLDYKELSRLVAKDLGGNVPAEVEAKLSLGKAYGFGGIVTVAGFVVSLAQLAIQIAETKKTSELVAALQAKTESAAKIDKAKREEIIDLIVDQLNRSK